MATLRRSIPRLAVLGVIAVLAGHVLENDFLVFAPLVLVLVPLLLGRYVGEKRIAQLARRRFTPRRRVAPASWVSPLSKVPHLLPRGGALIASSLAVRPPPALLLPA